MNIDKLIFSDKAYVVPCRESKSEIFLCKEDNLIESNSKIQSDNFSYSNEVFQSSKANEIIFQNSVTFPQSSGLKLVEKINIQHDNCIKLNDINLFKEQNRNYKITHPQNNISTSVGENIYFECALITDNPLAEENFNNLIWVSSLDGLIGVNNKFRSMLSLGEHIISLVDFDYYEGKNGKNVEVKIIKDEIKITITQKENNSTEIKQ